MSDPQPIDPGLSAAALAALQIDPNALGEYMNRVVSSTSVKITNAGVGLSKQLNIEPMILQPTETYYVLLEARGGTHTHKLIEKAGTWELVQELVAQTVTFVEGDDMEKLIRIAADRVQAAAEARKGVQRLDGTNADDLEQDKIAELEAEDGRPEPEWSDER